MEDFDDFIKGKLEQEPIAFNEAHWMKAAAMIEEDERKKRKSFLWLIFGAQMLIALVGLLLWWNVAVMDTYEADVQIATATQEQTDLTENHTQTAHRADGVKIPQVDEPHQQTTTNTSEEPINAQPSSSSAIVNNSTIDTKLNTRAQAELYSLAQKQENLSQKPINSATEIETKTSIEKHTAKTTNAETIVLATATENAEQTGEQKQNNTVDNPVTHTDLSSVNPDVVAAKDEHLISDETTEENTKAVAAKLVQKLEPIDFFNQALIASYAKREKETFAFSLARTDTKPAVQSKSTSKSNIGFYGAASLYPYNQERADVLIAYTAGLDFNYHIQANLSLTTGLHYRWREGNFNGTQETQQDSFAFRKITTSHQLLASELHYLELPLRLSFTKNKHQLGVGLQYARLLGVYGKMHRNSNENMNYEVLERGWLADDRFQENRFDAVFSYRFELKKHFNIGVKAHYVLNDWLRKGVASTTYSENKPFFIDIGVSYDLIKD